MCWSSPRTVRDPTRRPRRREQGLPDQPLVVVLSRGGELPEGARLFREPTGARLLVLPRSAPPVAPALDDLARRGELEVLRFGEESVDLAALLGELAARGGRTALVEGGGETLASFVEQDLLDELCVTICPVLLGGRDAPTAVEGRGLSIAGRRRLELLEVERAADELFLRYRVGRG